MLNLFHFKTGFQVNNLKSGTVIKAKIIFAKYPGTKDTIQQ